jgi:hypothetical protein
MRFAGQRFRSQRQGVPKFKAQRGQAESGRSPYANPTGTSAMTNMKEVNASSMAFTGMPDMSNPDFAIGNFNEPEFRAPSRI